MRLLHVAVVGACVALGLVSACSSRGGSGFDAVGDAGDASVDDAGVPSLGGPCVSLKCRQVACPNGGTTRVSGIVYSPSRGDPDPLYNAIVYVPDAPLDDFPETVTCDRCGAIASGKPLVVALSAFDGSFHLDNMPSGDGIPLVIQIGRWRREVSIPHVAPCTETVIGRDLTHMPRNQTEGNIPRYAISTGNADPIECVLRKIGIDDEEFTGPDGHGRVHIYQENGAVAPAGKHKATELYSDLSRLMHYDAVLFDCEGEANRKPPQALENLFEYTSAGGRVMLSHYGYVWLDSTTPLASAAIWNPEQPWPGDFLTAFVDQTFPKGVAFAQWLDVVQALSGPHGEIQIIQPRHDTNGVVPSISQQWISTHWPLTLQEFTFNTPIDVPAADQCGRVTYSDFHITGATLSSYGDTFPRECSSDPLTPQEKVLEFMLFDLSSCIQKDDTPPVPPPR